MRQLALVRKREMKVRVQANAGLARFFLGPFGRILILGGALLVFAVVAVFSYSYEKYSSLVEQKLRGPFANTAKIFAAPEAVAVGDVSSPEDIAADLRRSGYTESRSNPVGSSRIHLRSCIEEHHARDSPRHLLDRPVKPSEDESGDGNKHGARI